MTATDVPAGRALHLIDLENVLGDPRTTGPVVAATYEDVLARGHYRVGDLVVVASHPGLLQELGFAPHTPCQLLPARGRDGADLRLVGWAEPTWIARRFDRLVVASGDGLFADLVGEVRALGIAVDVVYGRGALSTRLQRADVPRRYVDVRAVDPFDPFDDHDLAA